MARERKRSVIGIASFVMGIFGIASIWRPGKPQSIDLEFGLILGSLAIILGAIALGKDKEDKGGRYGLLLGIIAVISGRVSSLARSKRLASENQLWNKLPKMTTDCFLIRS